MASAYRLSEHHKLTFEADVDLKWTAIDVPTTEISLVTSIACGIQKRSKKISPVKIDIKEIRVQRH